MSGPDSTTQVHTRLVNEVAAADLPAIRPGMTVARYLVIDELGRGGMGIVLRAYDPKLQREVALKVLRSTTLAGDARSRLVREARAMARLNHPNVAGVYDVELDAGAGIVLAMEYVPGATLRQWLRTPRSSREVLDAFVAAGRGLQAAHTEGLLHRDFKPANVLVGEDGRIRVTDFGLARVDPSDSSRPEPDDDSDISRDDDLSAELTAEGQVMGTVAYMAPEQHRGGELTPAADQYAFCVSLWQGLCGVAPFSGRKRQLLEAKLSGPPAWPKAVPVRRAVAEAIRRGMSVDPLARWGSMDALLAVLTVDPARRRTWMLVLATASLGALVAGVAVSGEPRAAPCQGAGSHLVGTWDEETRAHARRGIAATTVRYASTVWGKVEPGLDAYAEAWVLQHTDACEATAIRQEQSAAALDLRMACLHRARAALSEATTLFAAADEKVVENAHRIMDGLPPLSRCADLASLQAQVPAPQASEQDVVEHIRHALLAARTQRAAGHLAQARERVHEAKEALEGLTHGPVQAEVAVEVGLNHKAAGEFEEASASLRNAVTLGVAHGHWDAVKRAVRQLVFVVGYRQGRHAEGMVYADLAYGFAEATGDPVDEAIVRTNVAAILGSQGNYADSALEARAALALWTEARGAQHYQVAIARSNLGGALIGLGEYAQAESEIRAAVTLKIDALGSDHPSVATSRSHLGSLLYDLRRFEAAERELRSALAASEARLGADHPKVAEVRNNLGLVLDELGRSEEAEAQHRRALAAKLKAGQGARSVASSRANLGIALSNQGKHAPAEAELRAAWALLAEAGGVDADIAIVRCSSADVMFARGDTEQGEAEYRAGLDMLSKLLKPDNPRLVTRLTDFGRSLIRAATPARALPVLERAWAGAQGDANTDAIRGDIAFLLAQALWATAGDRSRARELAAVAQEAFAGAGATYGESLTEVMQWRARHR